MTAPESEINNQDGRLLLKDAFDFCQEYPAETQNLHDLIATFKSRSSEEQIEARIYIDGVMADFKKFRENVRTTP